MAFLALLLLNKERERNKGVMHRSGRSTERSTDMDRSKSNRHLRSSKTHRLCKLVEVIKLGKTDLRPMMTLMEKIVRIMTIDDEIKIRRDILEEKMILHPVTTMMMDRMMEVRVMASSWILLYVWLCW